MTTTHRFATTIAAAALAGLSLAACGKSTVEGAAGTKLSLYEPQAVVLHRGGTAKTDIKITRTSLPGDVKIKFTNLPKGVALVESDLDARIAGNDGTFMLSASENADLVENSVAQVTATGGDDIGVTKPISITVKENKP